MISHNKDEIEEARDAREAMKGDDKEVLVRRNCDCKNKHGTDKWMFAGDKVKSPGLVGV